MLPAELAVRRLIPDDAQHFTMANVRFNDIRLSGAELNWRRAEICDKDLERFITAYVSSPCGHEAHLVGEELGFRVDQDQTVLFSDDFNANLGVCLYYDSFRDLELRLGTTLTVHGGRMFVVYKRQLRLPTPWLEIDRNDVSVVHLYMATTSSNRFDVMVAVVSTEDNFRRKLFGNDEVQG